MFGFLLIGLFFNIGRCKILGILFDWLKVELKGILFCVLFLGGDGKNLVVFVRREGKLLFEVWVMIFLLKVDGIVLLVIYMLVFVFDSLVFFLYLMFKVLNFVFVFIGILLGGFV